MTQEERKRIYSALAAPFTDEAIERTEGRVTGKGYDTTGIKYQYVVNRLNEVLGIGGYRTQQTVMVKEATTSKGRVAYEATCEVVLQLGEWSDGKFLPFAEAYGAGGHTSMNEADARKGAFTNGFKKAAAMLGCGKQAYEGTLDDDNLPSETVPREQPSGQASTGPSANGDRNNRSVPAEYGHPVQGHSPSQGSAPNSSRNRLTSKQLGALMAISKRLGMQPSQFRDEVKRRFGVLPDFLDAKTASNLIGELTARASNGASHPLAHRAEA